MSLLLKQPEQRCRTRALARSCWRRAAGGEGIAQWRVTLESAEGAVFRVKAVSLDGTLSDGFESRVPVVARESADDLGLDWGKMVRLSRAPDPSMGWISGRSRSNVVRNETAK